MLDAELEKMHDPELEKMPNAELEKMPDADCQLLNGLTYEYIRSHTHTP